jgi:Holliday junction DNA helicase RuvB
MRGPFNHPHHGEDREIRLTRNQVRRDARRQVGPLASVRQAGPGLVNPAFLRMLARQQAPSVKIEPTNLDASDNPLRPASLDAMVGQAKLKPLLRRLIDNALSSGQPLDHLLLVGASGTGKTTTALVIARELGRRVFVLKAPVDMDTLSALCDAAQDGDVCFVDEIHMQVSGDRRGLTQACDPESFYLLLEDGILAEPRGPRPFPKVTWIGATTDVGLLPEPLTNRFPLQPRLAPYTEYDMAVLASANAKALGLICGAVECHMFAAACRLNPRQLNSYMRSAKALTADGKIGVGDVEEVIVDLAGCTLDGLTPSQQTVLTYLFRNCRRPYRDGTVLYSASVDTLASACGHGRDTKAIALLVEPWLLQQGYLEVRHTGRTLTERGIQRAKELCR